MVLVETVGVKNTPRTGKISFDITSGLNHVFLCTRLLSLILLSMLHVTLTVY